MTIEWLQNAAKSEVAGAILDAKTFQIVENSDGPMQIYWEIDWDGMPKRIYFQILKIEDMEIDPDVTEMAVEKYLELQNLGMV